MQFVNVDRNVFNSVDNMDEGVPVTVAATHSVSVTQGRAAVVAQS